MAWFDSIGGNVFYTTRKESNRFELYQADPSGNDRLVWNTPVARVQVLNDQLLCLFDEDAEYGAVVLNGSGEPLLKVADPISRVFTSNEGILLQSARDASVKFIPFHKR